MAEFRSRLGLGGVDKRISMVGTGTSPTATALKPTNTILHKTGSFASLRSLNKENDNSQIHVKEVPLDTEKPIPAFCPWSHEAFLHRLKTFAPVTSWLPKPSDEISEVVWAKRGWSCVGIETIACGACRRRLVVDFQPAKYGRESKRRRVRFDTDEDKVEKMGTVITSDGVGTPWISQQAPADNGNHDGEAKDEDDGDDANDYEYEEAFEKGLVAKYKVLVIDGHGDSCPWRQASCKDDIYRLPVVRRDWWQRHVSESFLSALGMAEDIGKLNLREVPFEPDAAKILEDMPPGFFTTAHQMQHGIGPTSRPGTARSISPRPRTPGSIRTLGSRASSPNGSVRGAQLAPSADPETAFSRSLQARALSISLTGWMPTTESSTNLLSCSACFQRVGLWLYQQGESPSKTEPRADSGHGDKPVDEENLDVPDPDDLPGLDLISQHREHCPFRNPASQAGTGDFSSLPAWQILYTTVSRWAEEQSRRSGSFSRDPAPEPMRGRLGHSVQITAGGAALSRDQVNKLDRERMTKMRKLRKALGIFRRPSTGKEGKKGSEG